MENDLSVQVEEAIFLYNHLWSSEVQRCREGLRARHHLFGLADLPNSQLRVTWLDAGGWRARVLANSRRYKALQAIWAMVATKRPRSRHRRVLLAVHEGAAYWSLLLKAVGLIQAPIVVVNVALLNQCNLHGWRNTLWRFLLRHATLVVSYASAQPPSLSRYLGVPLAKSVHIPFGVDVEFLSEKTSAAPLKARPSDPYFLSVGTNSGKDYPALLDAVQGISTKVVIVTDEHNRAQMARHGIPSNVSCESNIPITELRELYRHSLFGVIPLRDCLFSSGQTVLLENMAMGKAMIVSDVPAVRDYVIDNETALVYPPGDSSALRHQIQRLLANPDLREHLGERARQAALAHFSSEKYASNLANELNRAARLYKRASVAPE